MALDTGEAARIATLYSYGVLDTRFEERFDHQPRAEFTPADQSLLRDLADTVIDFFEMQNALRRAQAADRTTQRG